MAAKPRTVAKTAVKKKTASTAKKARTAVAAKKPPVGARRKPARPASPVALPLAPSVLDIHTAQGCNIVRFGSECTRHQVDDLRALLAEQVSRELPMVLDASAIERIDTAGVQLLVALSIDCMERGIAFCWKGRSAQTEHAVTRLGVAPLLESPSGVEQFAAVL
ncbi:MAG: STAS domain-containing protein [Gammaproteobacteria bacterium]|jgi:anti-anti-sigma regulatory factor|nr:STAS domain-containing protein [Gammaproteobacteria bacterium]